MAGTVDVATGRWQASSGLFYWVVDEVAGHVDDPATVRALREIDEENLGHLDVAALPEAGRAQVLRVLAGLAARAEASLPPSEGRGVVVARVRALSALASAASAATS